VRYRSEGGKWGEIKVGDSEEVEITEFTLYTNYYKWRKEFVYIK